MSCRISDCIHCFIKTIVCFSNYSVWQVLYINDLNFIKNNPWVANMTSYWALHIRVTLRAHACHFFKRKTQTILLYLGKELCFVRVKQILFHLYCFIVFRQIGCSNNFMSFPLDKYFLKLPIILILAYYTEKKRLNFVSKDTRSGTKLPGCIESWTIKTSNCIWSLQ